MEKNDISKYFLKKIIIKSTLGRCTGNTAIKIKGANFDSEIPELNLTKNQ